MNFGSVCSGIEAASVAWHPLGWKASWLAEIEKFPSAVLAHHYPDVPNLGDMTKIAAAVRDGSVAAPDVLVGGTPCQAFSVAGLRGGLSDARGQLTLSYVELADAIDTARLARGEQPAIIVWENVPGVLSSKDNAFGCFLGALAGEDCELKPAGRKWSNAGCVFGPTRTVAWRVFDAQYFGVAQRRRRVFVVASARDGFDPTSVLFELEGVRRDTAPRREAGQVVAAGTLRSTDGGSDVDHARAGHIQPGSVTCMAHGQGGAEIAVERSPTLTCNHEAPIAFHAAPYQSVANSLCAADGRGANGQHADDHKLVPTVLAFSAKDYGNDVAVELAPTLRAGGHTTSHANAGVMPAIAFSARQDPDSWTERTGPLDTDGSTQAVAFAENSRAELRYESGDGSVTGALKVGGGKPGQSYPVAMVGMKVRRLTPRECERLQGFPDDYTQIPVKVKRLAPAGAGPCVKQTVTATIVAANGAHYVGTNHCMTPQTACPRAGMPTGVGYELCKSVCTQPAHAEVNAIKLAGKHARGATLYLQGHTYACEMCKAAAAAAGIVEIIIGPPPGNAADGPRYKALGNSMAVPCMHWIGKRIAAAVQALDRAAA